MKVKFKVFKGNEFKGVEYFIEKYEGHFQVLADLYKKQGMRIERI